MFPIKRQELGSRPVGKEITLEYPYSDSVSIITKMISPCDCSLPYDYRSEKKVVIKYTPKPVPEHLKLEGKSRYIADKHFIIHFVDTDGIDQMETISFTATIY